MRGNGERCDEGAPSGCAGSGGVWPFRRTLLFAHGAVFDHLHFSKGRGASSASQSRERINPRQVLPRHQSTTPFREPAVFTLLVPRVAIGSGVPQRVTACYRVPGTICGIDVPWSSPCWSRAKQTAPAIPAAECITVSRAQVTTLGAVGVYQTRMQRCESPLTQSRGGSVDQPPFSPP